MQDLVLDTNLLSEFLAQYFHQPQRYSNFTEDHVNPANKLNSRVVQEIRKIIKSYNEVGVHCLLVASTFAFLEIARKFKEISKDRYSIKQFSSFLDQPPEWFLVASVDSSLFLPLTEIPAYVTMPGGQRGNIEWADAIHLATALSRENCLFATTDKKLRQIICFQNQII